VTLLTLNDRIERIERAHPEILISAPWATRSGRWQVIAPGFNQTYDNGFAMISDLEKRYPPKPEGLRTPRGPLAGTARMPQGLVGGLVPWEGPSLRWKAGDGGEAGYPIPSG
jgi:hypothetical protein